MALVPMRVLRNADSSEASPNPRDMQSLLPGNGLLEVVVRSPQALERGSDWG